MNGDYELLPYMVMLAVIGLLLFLSLLMTLLYNSLCYWTITVLTIRTSYILAKFSLITIHCLDKSETISSRCIYCHLNFTICMQLQTVIYIKDI